MSNHNYAREIFFVTEGTTPDDSTYESCYIARDCSDEYLRILMEEFIKNRKNGPARLMVSNREDENWE